MNRQSATTTPYGPYPENSDLPPSVQRRLPPQAQEVFRKAYNRALQVHEDVEHARRVAWTAVGRGYQEKADGTWVKRTDDADLGWSLADLRRPGSRNAL